MLRIGLTGNIAAGKSSVVRVWRELGAPVVDADELARRAVEPGSSALDRIVARWGPEILASDGGLDRAALRRIVFGDPAEREHLESIVHPAVAALRDEELARLEARGEPLVVADIPLLFEAGLQEQFDRVVLVDAPEEVRLERIVRDRGLAPDEARGMIRAQMPAVLKRSRADLVIDNSGTQQELERRAREAWEELRRAVELEAGG